MRRSLVAAALAVGTACSSGGDSGAPSGGRSGETAGAIGGGAGAGGAAPSGGASVGGQAGAPISTAGAGGHPPDASSTTTDPRDAGARDAPNAVDAGASVGCGEPPKAGLYIWLSADRGVTADAQGAVTAWANQVGNEVARAPTDPRAPKGKPLLVKNAIGGRPVVRFRGNPDLALDPASDLLHMDVTVDKQTRLTIALVNATTRAWTSSASEWCHRATATGCSSTYNWVFGWAGVTSWSGVFVNPRDTEIGWRFGPGMDLDSHCFVNDDTSGPDPCMKWPRPASIGSKVSATIMIHDEKSNRLYVDGAKVHEAPIAHGVAAVDTAPPLNIGNNTFAHNGGGELAEALVYKAALADAEREALAQYLRCMYGTP